MKESIIKDTERKKEEITAVRGECEAEVEKLKSQLQDYENQADKIEVLTLEKKVRIELALGTGEKGGRAGRCALASNLQ